MLLILFLLSLPNNQYYDDLIQILEKIHSNETELERK
jgi:hypothetical protein